MLKKLSAFWRNNKTAIIAVASLTPAAVYLPAFVPAADIAAEVITAVETETTATGESQPGQSQDETK